jgi:transcriptional regulator with XRE-family HTH domain
MARGRKPNLKRRGKAAELRARGLTLVEVGRRMGCTRQAVHQLLQPPDRRRVRPPRPPPPLACAACGANLGPAPGMRDYDPPLCLPCLARRPRATFGERLRARRIAEGLSRRAIAERAGVGAWEVKLLEDDKHRPLPGTLHKLAQALGIEPGELLPGRRRTPRPRPGPGRSENAVRVKRCKLGIPNPSGLGWTAEELALLGTAPDAEVSAQIGRTETAVTLKRCKLGIPNPSGPGWTAEELALLGTAPDAEVAAQIGRTERAVTLKRCKLGIPTFCDRRRVTN